MTLELWVLGPWWLLCEAIAAVAHDDAGAPLTDAGPGVDACTYLCHGGPERARAVACYSHQTHDPARVMAEFTKLASMLRAGELWAYLPARVRLLAGREVS